MRVLRNLKKVFFLENKENRILPEFSCKFIQHMLFYCTPPYLTENVLVRLLIKQTEYLVIYVQHKKITSFFFLILEPHLTS